MEIEITINDAHLKEHYGEWLAVLGPNTRLIGKIGLALIVTGAAVGFTQVGTGNLSQQVLRYGAYAAFLGCYLRFDCARKRWAWLRLAKLRKGYGTTRLFFVYDGGLCIAPPPGADPNQEEEQQDREIAELVVTPRGYFARFPDDQSSVYLPHRSIEPPTTRGDFLSAIGVTPPAKSGAATSGGS